MTIESTDSTEKSSVSCFEVRRVLGLSAAEAIETYGEHIAECYSCAEAYDGTRRFESRLKVATKVEVPEGLASRILMAHSFENSGATPGTEAQTDPQATIAPRAPAAGAHPPARATRAAWGFGRRGARRTAVAGAMAAAISAVAVMVVLPGSPLHQPAWVDAGEQIAAKAGFDLGGEHDQLAREAIAMVRASPYALNARGPAPAGSVNEALEAVGMRVAGDLGAIRFAGNCLVRQQLAGHIVIEGDHAPITVFVMPETDATREGSFADEQWASVVLPTSRGSIAVVGAPGESLAPVIERVRAAIGTQAAVQVDVRAGAGFYG